MSARVLSSKTSCSRLRGVYIVPRCRTESVNIKLNETPADEETLRFWIPEESARAGESLRARLPSKPEMEFGL
ncbi:hypothetical protein KC19_4G011800 [Ceratodon purpureus]|uniref:Uncharacterized protein n=1 Tax=Ceratodon purpureus TaxID=3225 RepID=A0A8T0I458_CERPU|nr:hypothetical protein KC19_4G011800 [Ceratodon purpureus]